MNQKRLFITASEKKRYEDLKPSFMRICEFIDFESFRGVLHTGTNQDEKSPDKGGRPSFDVVMMFKIIVLQTYYDSSDDQMEFMLRDRKSFRQFVGLSDTDVIPDSKTIWHIKNKWAKAHLLQPLFDELNQQIQAHGFKAQGGQMIDATITETRRPTGRHRNQDGSVKEDAPPAAKAQLDQDLSFTKKNEKTYCGYKAHVNVDKTHKIVRKITITTAKTHDSQVFADLLDDQNTTAVLFADSAYQSTTHQQLLDDQHIQNKMIRKAYRNTPLSDEDKRLNKTHSKTRGRVEHVFGHVKNWGRKHMVRSIGKTRATLQVGMRFIVYNMQRCRFLCESSRSAQCHTV